MVDILKFPGNCEGTDSRSVRAGDANAFMQLRIGGLLRILDEKVQEVNGENVLKMEDLFEFLVSFERFLPGEQMRFFEEIDPRRFELRQAEAFFNCWVDAKHETASGVVVQFGISKKLKEDRKVFSEIFAQLKGLETGRIKGFKSFYESKGNAVQKYALTVILRYAYINFAYFLKTFADYLHGLETEPANIATLLLLRNAVTEKVKMCLDTKGEKKTK